MRLAASLLILLTFNHFASAQESGWQTVEEVLAVVGETPILSSDIELGRLVVLTSRESLESDDAYQRRLLEARIRLEIQFRDLEESGLLFRLELDSARALRLLIERGGGLDEVETGLRRHGLVRADLDELALRVAAVDAYVEQRLRPRVTVTIEEIEAAYQELLVKQVAASDESVPPLAEVRDQLYRLLIERKLNEEIERWVERTATRHEVTRYSE